ncbi:hypothetical protein RMSM_00545 [Rhodopirellula maiorica SM1]|uniref:Uncharacterized protein n=2 Tax=Novipirellula TaxID=2795426 RepID=M5RTA1_9BACT|nr:hypothetical protein RMSM_00545 [Rhodopirellula maiorica SM1]
MQSRTTKNFAELVCSRPQMWTVDGTLPEVISFLSGVNYARQAGAPEGDQYDGGSPRALLDWLTDEFSLPGMAANANWISGMRDRYGTDEAALAAMQQYAKTLPSEVDRRYEIGYSE